MSKNWVWVPGRQKYLILYHHSQDHQVLLTKLRRVKADVEEVEVKDRDHQAALLSYLSIQKMGTYLYGFLPETMIHSIAYVVKEAGFTDDDMQMCAPGDKHRPVFCAHCHAVFFVEPGDEITCPECRCFLEVSDNWSVFHQAYLGSYSFKEGET
ncbi:hypothetical protein [Alteribacter keqinensis]|uniref:Dimethylamine monooxygenase subunit DmmA-like C-terminal domain-containing protein n=1 Tax=Alteribacter keqinensis TaxID=2483800 RepID=A0A3M7TWM3_9BACI|nr:hypothetical protein [Alteribacter keqinensis]RNA69302.1 hypothetical protein EBO34_04980 [Alteribacter keqinensis]